MYEAEPCGHLLVKGRAVNDRALAVQAGLSAEEVTEGLTDLEQNGVFSRTSEGTIFSRKMVRDARKSEEQRQRAASRWSAENSKETETGIAETMPDAMPPHMPTRTRVPDAIFQKPELALEPASSIEEDSVIPLSKSLAIIPKTDGFVVFWKDYPNKTGKKDAEKKYRIALKDIGGADPQAVIMAGLERAKTNPRWEDPAYIPNPSTWLHQGRWDDEPAEAPASIVPRQARWLSFAEQTDESLKKSREDAIRIAQEEQANGRRF